MSLLFIVDGYNVIKRSPLLRDKELRPAREALLAFIEGHRPHGSLKNRVVVVFDGSSKVAAEGFAHPADVIFTQGQSADDKIKAIVRSCANPKNVVLVTDDKGLGLSCRPLGVRLMGTEEFLKTSVRRERQRRGRDVQELKAELDIVEQEEITEELKKIWLKSRSS